jgi:uncharacterized phiE125 gp8 family phage protein
MILRKTVAATASPISLLEASDHLRISDEADDALVTATLAAAVAAVGEMAGRVLAAETWAASYPSLSGDLILPKSPVTAVTAIQYYDTSDVLQTATLSDFYVFTSDDFTTVRPKANAAWPQAMTRADAITVTFTAGYATCPYELKAAAMLMLGHLYENREASVVGASVATLPYGVDPLVSLHRLGWAAA